MLTVLLDPNRLATWLVGAWCLLGLVRVARLARARQGRGVVLDGLWSVGLVGGVLAGGRAAIPSAAGYLALAVWALLAWFPTAMSRYAGIRGLRRDFAGATRAMVPARWLRPFSGAHATQDYYRALAWIARGQRRAGLGLLRRLEGSSSLGDLARFERLSVGHEWGAICAAGDAMGAREGRLSPLLVPRYLRALGELDELPLLLAVLERYRATLAPQPLLLLPALLSAFAFGGRVAAVQGLLRGSLGALEHNAQALWMGTAEIAAGEVERGVERLTAAQATADAQQRESLELRLRAAIAGRSRDLPVVVAVTLERLERWSAALARSVPGYGPRRLPVMTALAVGLLLAVFAVEELAGGSTRQATLAALGALEPERVAAGEWWRVVTAVLLHMGPVHLVMNLIPLIPLGGYLEHRLGGLRTGLALLVCGVLPMATHVGLWWLGFEATAAVGASGAVMGGVGIAAAVLLRAVVVERLFEARRYLRVLVFLVVLQTLIDWSVPFVDFLSHSLGLTVGFVLGVAFVRLPLLPAVLITVLGLTLAFGGQLVTSWIPWRRPPCGPGELMMCETACELGLPEACGALGYKLGVGEDVAVDRERAVSLLRGACDEGVADACNNLGVFVDEQHEPGRVQAARRGHFERACRLGSNDGCCNLGRLLVLGAAGPGEAERGVRLLAEACDGGDHRACRSLEELCGGGYGVACRETSTDGR